MSKLTTKSPHSSAPSKLTGAYSINSKARTSIDEERAAKTTQVSVFGDFLKYWDILSFFHSCTIF